MNKAINIVSTDSGLVVLFADGEVRFYKKPYERSWYVLVEPVTPEKNQPINE